MTAINKQRSRVLDVAKGLAMLLVVYAHINYKRESLIYIYSFHMPFFFLLSGVFFDKKKYSFSQFVKNRFVKLICPYLFFSVLLLVATIAIEIVTGGFSLQTIESLKSPFIQIFIAQNSSVMLCAPLWFVPCLFVVEILYYAISKLKTPFIVLICSLLVVAGWLLESKFAFVSAYLPWSIDSALFSIGFYAIGNLAAAPIKAGINKIQESKYKMPISLTLALVLLVSIAPLAFLNGKITLGSKILNNGFLLYLTGVLGTAGVIALSIALEKISFLSFLGKNTFCIMSVHYFINYYLKATLVKLGFEGYDITNVVHTVVPFIVVLGLSCLCVLIYNYAKKIVFSKKQKCSSV